MCPWKGTRLGVSTFCLWWGRRYQNNRLDEELLTVVTFVTEVIITGDGKVVGDRKIKTGNCATGDVANIQHVRVNSGARTPIGFVASNVG